MLELQRLFQEMDLVDRKLIEFLIYLDKGHSAASETHLCQQKVEQPIHIRSGCGFNNADG